MDLEKIINESIRGTPELAQYYQSNKDEINDLIIKMQIKKGDIQDIIKLHKIIDETDISFLERKRKKQAVGPE